MRSKRLAAVAVAVLAAAGLLASAAPPASATQATSTKKVSARWVLSHLTVASASGSSTYARSKFKLWIDADHDGCDTRHEVLIKESKTKVHIGAGCKITGGKWVSWYDGVTTTNSSTFDIDHVVPLEEAWVSGARKWTAATRTAYANDLRYAWSLDAVTAHSNRSKGDRDPAHWLPAKSDCTYAVHWVAIKYRWRLTVDKTEKAKLTKLLAGSCGARTLSVPPRGTSASRSTATPPAKSPPATPALDPMFSTCKEAKAHGYGPYYRGSDPEYYWYRDADHDGVDCE